MAYRDKRKYAKGLDRIYMLILLQILTLAYLQVDSWLAEMRPSRSHDAQG